jgi:glucose/arabinose dehydrogenase
MEVAGERPSFPLKLPSGFSISVFAKDLPGARVMLPEPVSGDQWRLWVSQTSAGQISRVTVQGGRVVGQDSPGGLQDLRKPHGLALPPGEPGYLYVAEEHQISRRLLESGDPGAKIADLPTGGNHFTRTIGFGPDGRLYVAIGSSCNVCHEADQRRAKIYSMNSDGSDFNEYARGLRNAVFFAWHPVTEQLWATEMGRDLLGDDLPPDEINIVREGGNYGWPTCYGKNVHDATFDKNTYLRNPCQEPFETPSFLDIPAHSAPLGLAFVPPTAGWPEEYWYNLLVAYHGSWNRSVPTGYKVVRFKLDREGRYLGSQDFITGWLRQTDGRYEALGRPVDIAFGPDGATYISDDKAGLIYRVTYAPSP